MIKLDIKMPTYCFDCPCHNGENGRCQISGNFTADRRPFDCPLSEVDEIPAVDVEPVRHGHWIIKPIDKMSKYKCTCSACGWDVNCDSWRDPFDLDETEFCPHCGAKMDEENENDG